MTFAEGVRIVQAHHSTLSATLQGSGGRKFSKAKPAASAVEKFVLQPLWP
jgi:hypothetical protein